MTDTGPVVFELENGVATITLARPESMNSLDGATRQALLDAIQRASGDKAARAVILTGTGRAFCVGQDLREHADNLASLPPDEVWRIVDAHYSPIARALATMPKPVIAAVNGVAAGAGMSIALACDLRIGSERASFNTAFTGVALSCDTGCSWSLPRLVGPSKALQMLLFPMTIAAAEALQLGLLTSLVDGEVLAREAATLAARLATGPTLAYAAVKKALAYGSSHTLDEALATESELMALTGASRDHVSAVQSFLAKEKPTYIGG